MDAGGGGGDNYTTLITTDSRSVTILTESLTVTNSMHKTMINRFKADL